MVSIQTTKKRFGRPPSKESEEAIKATALEARLRQQFGVEEYLAQKRGARAALADKLKRLDNPLLGYALGRLLHGKEIDQAQHDAGTYFVWLWKANSRLRGWPSPNVRAIDYGATTGGFSTHTEDSPEWIDDVRQRWGDTYRFILDAQKDFGPVFEILKRTLVEDLGPMNEAELGNLRIGLNAINSARGVK